MSSTLTLTAALLLGLMTSGHCLLMCGGITGALAVATRSNAAGRPRFDLLAGYQLGRITSYATAGLLVGGIGGGVVAVIDHEEVRIAVRWLSAVLLSVAATSLLLRGRGFDFGLGKHVWRAIAPIARRLLPVRSLAQALALGSLWGWMPCGLVYSMLVIAALSMGALHGALIMFAFGLGTVPAVFAGAYGAQRIANFLARARMRVAAATALIVLAALTAGGPWLVAHSGIHALRWLPFDCVTQ